MIPVTVMVRTLDRTTPPHAVEGFTPDTACAIAVTRDYVFDVPLRTWRVSGTQWHISHVPTGYRVSDRLWATLDEAYAVLLRCDPTFPAWPLAAVDAGAMTACKYKFRMALQ